jgi:hypothetical protein
LIAIPILQIGSSHSKESRAFPFLNIIDLLDLMFLNSWSFTG